MVVSNIGLLKYVPCNVIWWPCVFLVAYTEGRERGKANFHRMSNRKRPSFPPFFSFRVKTSLGSFLVRGRFLSRICAFVFKAHHLSSIFMLTSHCLLHACAGVTFDVFFTIKAIKSTFKLCFSQAISLRRFSIRFVAVESTEVFPPFDMQNPAPFSPPHNSLLPRERGKNFFLFVPSTRQSPIALLISTRPSHHSHSQGPSSSNPTTLPFPSRRRSEKKGTPARTIRAFFSFSAFGKTTSHEKYSGKKSTAARTS